MPLTAEQIIEMLATFKEDHESSASQYLQRFRDLEPRDRMDDGRDDARGVASG